MNLPSLSSRLAWLVGIAVVLILGTAALLMDHLVDASMGQRFDANLLTKANTVASLVELGTHGAVIDPGSRFGTHLLSSEEPASYIFDCNDGSTLISKPAPLRQLAHWRDTAQAQAQFADIAVPGKPQRAVWFSFRINAAAPNTSSTDLDQASCRLLFMQPRVELDDILTAIDGILLLTPLLALFAVLALTPLLVRRGLKALTTLGDNMRAIGPQAPRQRLHASGTRELDPLVTRFNEVLARMDEGVARERQFAAALAHETRTRLAELRALVEVEQRFPSDRSRDELLADIGAIGNELADTVAGVLLLARLDAGIEDIEHSTVDVGALIVLQVEQLTEVLQQRDLRFDLRQTSAPLLRRLDPALLAIIVRNLLANAAAYAPLASTIVIKIDASMLTVSNPAPELDAEDVRQFGRRFWSKHSADAAHAGIGLALAGAAAA
ncbi:MAG: hypothetical protein L0H70_07890, partial [Xanthomonadales bacterium]|nr:hypothetical protein [Xanthomonadales bacterium]